MRDFLDDYIVTVSDNRKVSIQKLLASAQVGKEHLDEIASRLNSIQSSSSLSVDADGPGTKIDVAKYDRMHRELSLKFQELFDASNLISTLLDSETNILTSEIKALEDELIAIEKAIENYAFTLADNGFYDYAFMESFNDDMMKEVNIVSSGLNRDRGGQSKFNPSEIAIADGSNGLLALSMGLGKTYGLLGSTLNSNFAMSSSDRSSFSNCLNQSSNTGWKINVRSDTKITSSIYSQLDKEEIKKGAQIWLEIYPLTPSVCDAITLTPFSDIPIDILRIEIYTERTGICVEPTYITKESVYLDRPKTINFERQPVSAIKLLVNQSIYKRKHQMPLASEIRYRSIHEELKNSKQKSSTLTGTSYINNSKALKKVFLKTQKRIPNLSFFRSEIPKIDFDRLTGPITIDRVIHTQTSDKKDELWSYKSKINTLMRRMIHETFFASNPYMLNDRYVFNLSNNFTLNGRKNNLLFTSGFITDAANYNGVTEPQLDSDDLLHDTLNANESLAYYYELGLRNISIGMKDNPKRGLFISKIIPAPSDSGEVKLKANYTNYDLVGSSRDSSRVTSVEYSVTNKSKPNLEREWIPIIPIDDLSIESERLFLDEFGFGKFRFPASLEDSVLVFKNGYKIDQTTVEYIKSDDKNSIIGVKISIGSFTSNDIFTVDYTPFGEHKIINFDDKGFSQTSLATAFDDKGSGQTFSSTYGQRTIALNNEPFIDYDQVNLYGDYSTTLGFTGSYQPITIVLSDGTIALNQTNYKGSIQNSLSSFDEEIVFLHSGKNIIFNKQIDQEFTVYYQYIPSNLRFRVVLRINTDDFVSPTVDFVQIKTKTKKPDPRRIL